MNTSHEPDENETALRNRLRHLGVRPAGHSADRAEPQSAPAATITIPPPPDYPPTAAAPPEPEPAEDTPRRPLYARLPDWRTPNKPHLGATAPGEDTDAEKDDQPRPALRKAAGPSPVANISKTTDAEDDTEDDDLEDEDEEEAGEEPRKTRLPSWITRRGESTRPSFAAPAFPSTTGDKERKSLVQAARELSPEAKWLIYHATGLAAGLYFGVPQYALDLTASVARSYPAMRDNIDSSFWIVGGLVVLVLDRVTRGWVWPVAWAARGVTTSVVLGALLYGNPIPS